MKHVLTALVAFGILLPAGMCRCEVLAPFETHHEHELSDSCCEHDCHHESAPGEDHAPACPEKTGAMQWKSISVTATTIDLAAPDRPVLLPAIPSHTSRGVALPAPKAARPLYLLLLNLLI